MEGLSCCCLCSDKLDVSVKHPLCDACLEKIIEERGLIFPKSKEDTPSTNDYRKANASSIVNVDQEEFNSCSKKMRAMIEEQKSNTRNLILESDNLRSHIKEYDDFLWNNMTQHEEYLQKIQELVNGHETVVMEITGERERLVEMQKELQVVKGCVKEKLPKLNTAKNTTAAIAAIDELDQSFAALEKWCELCQQNLLNETIITTSEKVLSITRAALSVVDSRKGDDDSKTPRFYSSNFSIPQKIAIFRGRGTLTVKEFLALSDSVKKSLQEGKVYAVQNKEGVLRYAAMSMKDDEIYLHCLQDEEPSALAHTVEHKELLQTLDKALTTAFIDLASEGTVKGRVHIQLSPETPLSRQFSSLCLGDLGPSYLHSKFFRKGTSGSLDYMTSGDYQHNDGSGGASAIEDVEKDEVSYKRSCTEGSVFLLSDKIDRRKSAQFSVITFNRSLQSGGLFSSCSPEEPACIFGGRSIETPATSQIQNRYVFGQISKGFPVVKEAAFKIDIKDVMIVACGVVLSRKIK